MPGGALGADQPSLDDHLILARYVLLWQRVLMVGPRIARFDWHRALWGVPAILAAVVTAYLAWGAWISARHPKVFYRNHVWWHAWLSPHEGDGTLLVVVALWLLAAVVYWRPRRQERESVGLIIVAAMVVIGAVLGTASLAPCRGGQSRTAVAAWVLSLYVGSLEGRYGTTTCPSLQYPLALQLARAVCLAAAFVGVLAVAAVLWRQPIGRLRARMVKDATILTGLDAMTIPLLHSLTSGGHEKRVVVIEPDGHHPLLEEARATGAQIVVADPTSARLLMPLLRGLRGPQLRNLYSLRPDASDNEAVLIAAKSVLDQIGDPGKPPERPPHLIARIDDPRHADLWRGQHVGASNLWFEDAISPQESTARALVHQICSTGARQVLLCGDSTLALATLLELAHRAWESGELAEKAAEGVGTAGGGQGRAADPAVLAVAETVQRMVVPYQIERVVLLDRRAEDLRREYLATSPELIAAALTVVSPRAQAWRDHLLPCLDAMPEADAARTAVVIADAHTEASMHEAGRVAQLHRDTPVFVLSADGAGVTGAVFDLLQPFQRALLVNGAAPEDTWTRIARHWHECYRLEHPVAPGDVKESTRRPWAELDEFVREDNILQLRSVMAEVAAHDRRWVPNRAVVPGSYVELSNRELEDVAHAEHSRWYERHLAVGRRSAASGEPDDDNAPDNNYDRPWTDLPLKMRERNREYVRIQLEQLEAVGFMPVLPDCGPPAAAGFQRLGEVRAEQLAASRPWRNRAGDKLTGVAGDWHVIDESGDERTVRDKEFLDSHEQMDGDRWRRTGTVRAWPVSDAVRVRTLEGGAEADPGDWIIQGPSGVRWPVKDEQFTRSYRAYIS